jgi:hypothetical protein
MKTSSQTANPNSASADRLRQRLSGPQRVWETIENLVHNIEKEEQDFRRKYHVDVSKILAEGGQLPIQTFKESDIADLRDNLREAVADDARRRRYLASNDSEDESASTSTAQAKRLANEAAHRFLMRSRDENLMAVSGARDDDTVEIDGTVGLSKLSGDQESEFLTLFEACMQRFFDQIKPKGIYVARINESDELGDLEDGETYLRETGEYVEAGQTWLNEAPDIFDDYS